MTDYEIVVSAPECVPPGSARFIHTAQLPKYESETAIATHVEGGKPAVSATRTLESCRLSGPIL